DPIWTKWPVGSLNELVFPVLKLDISGIWPEPVPTFFVATVPKPTFLRMTILLTSGMLSAFCRG
ncbi:hypothetical protein, partial [Enterobacter roggenkampii]|uniref:hypothetical protein n=1 Tax=Enterobacter roggenkampii TaxID=1812935 RepID=UPI00197AD126